MKIFKVVDNKTKDSENLKKLVRSKQYFSVGFEWYFDRYLSSFWQRRIYTFLFLVVAVGIFALFKLNLDLILDPKIPVPLVTHIDNYNEIAFVKSLKSKSTVNPNILVANYLAEKYVEIRESYSYKDLENKRMFVMNNSTGFLYLEYEEGLSVSNPKSPLLMYGKNEVLITKIKKVETTNDDSGLPSRAEVKFDLYKIGANQIRVMVGSYTANLEFYMNDIYAIRKQKSSNFIFSVLRYNVMKNKN